MYLLRSHGRLSLKPALKNTWKKVVAARAYWPVALSLTAGIYMGIQYYSPATAQDEREASAHREVSDQARLMTESFWSQLDSIRSQAIAFRQLRLAYQSFAPNTEVPKPWGRIQHWAEFGIAGSALGDPKLHSPGANWKPGVVEQAEQNYLRSVQEKISLREIKESGISLVRIKLDSLTSTEKVAIGFFADSKNSVVNVVLVDPSEVFPVFKRFASKKDEGTLRAYLIAADGKVLIHSLPSYNAASFVETEVFTGALMPLLSGTRGNGTGSFTSIDQIPVYSAFSRLGKLPFAIVVERAALESSTQASTSGSQVSGAGFLIALMLLASSLVPFARRWRARRAPAAAKTSNEAELEAILDQMEGTPLGIIMGDAAIAAGPPIPIQNEEAVRNTLEQELVASQQALRTAQQERNLLNRFEQEAAALKDPKVVAAKLTQAATQLCGSPTLYFVHHEGLGSAILQSDAGFPPGSAPVAMSFPMEPAMLLKIQEAAKGGELINLCEYEPLARILMNRIGVAHFEAWPLSGFGHLGRQSGRPRILGILVILQAGVDSVTRHDSLCRMMRMTGLVYENSLLSR